MRHYLYKVTVEGEERSGFGSLDEIRSRVETAYPHCDAASDPEDLDLDQSADITNDGEKVGSITFVGQA